MDQESVIASAPARENPYIGPRPFLTGEKMRFFGRDREAELLIPLIISERLVLFYAQSGAGKSSLLNAKIIPGLQERNFITLSGRVSGSERSKNEVGNIFIYNLLVSLDPEKSKTTDLTHTSLADYLADLDVDAFPVQATNNGTVPLDAPHIVDGVQPLVLIIDQFEEIFNTHPEAWDHRAPFFDQLCEAMVSDPYLWVVLTIREDYVAQLDPFAGQLPGRMRARFYMQRMKKDAALEAVVRPVQDTSPFVPDAAKALVDSLSMIAVGRDEKKGTIFEPGEFIEPVQLQVVCYQLWENLKPQPGTTITQADLNRVAGEHGLAGFIVRALREFYEGVLQNVLSELREKGRPISERALREWFSTALITEEGTRSSVFYGDTYTGSLPNYAVDLLDRRFIIRSELRAGGRWYELVHDRLIQPIRSSNADWLAANTTKLEKDALAWKQSPDPTRLYSGRLLKEALELQKNGDLTAVENEFIRESIEEADRKKAAQKRTRRLLIGSGIAAVVFLIMGLVSLYFMGSALIAEDNAQTAEANANREKAAAESASTQVAVERNQAEAAKADAEAAKNVALTQEANARSALEAQKIADQKTMISRLAAYAKYYVMEPESKDLSLLFAVEAWKEARDSWEAREALSYTVWNAYNNAPYDILVQPHGDPLLSPDSGVFALDINSSGKMLATGGNDGRVNVWDLETESLREDVPDKLQNNFRVYSIQFSPDDRYLALGGGEGQVKIWDIQANKLLPFFRPEGNQSLIHALAFDSTSSYLAIALGDGRLIIYSLASQEKVAEQLEPSGDIWSVAWSPVEDDPRVAYGGKAGVIHVYNVQSQKEEKALANVLYNPIQGLVWSKDAKYIFAGSQDRQLIRWEVDAPGYVVARSRQEDTQTITSLDINKEGNVLVSGNGNPDQSLTLWDAKTLRPVGYPKANNGWVRAVSFDASGKYFASGGDDFRAYVFEVNSLDPLAKTSGSVPGGGIMEMANDPQDGLVALKHLGTGVGQSLQLYSATTLEPLGNAYPIQYGSIQMTVRNNRLELVVGRPGEVIFLDPRTGEPLQNEKPITLPDLPVTALGIRPDGKVLGVAVCTATSSDPSQPVDPNEYCLKSSLLFWDLDAGRELWRPETDHYVTSLGISPNGQIVLGQMDGDMFYYPFNPEVKTLPEGEKSYVLDSPVIRTDFSPDGKLLFTATYSGDLQLWDPAARRLIIYMGNEKEKDDFVSGAMFKTDEDGRVRLYTGSWFGHLRNWDVDSTSWAQRACGLASSDMSEESWKQNFPNNDQPGQICPIP